MAEIGGACQGPKVGGLLDALRFYLSLLDAIETLSNAIRCCLAASDLKKGSHDREFNLGVPGPASTPGRAGGGRAAGGHANSDPTGVHPPTQDCYPPAGGDNPL